MENTYFVKTFCGCFVIVTGKQFDEFIDVLSLSHPHYLVVKTDRTLCNHKYYIKHYYVDDEEVACVVNDPDYLPFS